MTPKDSSDKGKKTEDKEQGEDSGGGGRINYGTVGGKISGPPGGGKAPSRKTAGRVGGPISGGPEKGKSEPKK